MPRRRIHAGGLIALAGALLVACANVPPESAERATLPAHDDRAGLPARDERASPPLQGERAAQPPRDERVALPAITAFSKAKPGTELPGGWRVWTLSRLKKPTEYQMVSLRGRNVIRAHAHGSASGLSHDVDVDPKVHPTLRWRWMVEELIPGADNTKAQSEDSPVRIVLAFAGDKSKWDFSERILATQLRMLAGFEMPYATLSYIWENRVPKGTVIHSQHTGRSKMIVVQSGREKLGQWLEESRNIHEDYRRAFGEDPGKLYAIAIMTDTDNTGAISNAYYGDIAFERASAAAAVK